MIFIPINPKFAGAMQIAKAIPALSHNKQLKRRAVLILCAELKKVIG